MLKVHPLYSSSSGNMFHIETDKANILIDIGVSYKAINFEFKNINKDIKDINAIFITHEHVDHIKGLPLLCRKNNIPIYACGKTADYLNEMLEEQNIDNKIIKIDYEQKIKVFDIELTPFETSHDALSPCGYDIYSNGKHISYATDLGFISDDIEEHMKFSDLVVVEANYDKTLLEFGPYPFNTKRRIAGVKGHLSNEDTASLISKLSHFNCSNYIISHISENNNTLDMLNQTLDCTLKQNNIERDSLNINFASKTLSSEEYVIV